MSRVEGGKVELEEDEPLKKQGDDEDGINGCFDYYNKKILGCFKGRLRPGGNNRFEEKLKQFSEVMSRTIGIRKKKRRNQCQTQYSPESYAMNFEEDDDDHYHRLPTDRPPVITL